MESEFLKYQLCYVDNNFLYFCSNFKNVWGDDWNDVPYEHNAGEPYADKEQSIEIISFYSDLYDISLPCGNFINSPYSVEGINKGAIPWLICNKSCLWGGDTLETAIKFFQKNSIKWARLHY